MTRNARGRNAALAEMRQQPAAVPADAVSPPSPTYAPSYSPGAHTGSVRAFHDARRTELLARDEVLAGEIAAREAERHDINEALRLMSDPAESNVQPLRQPVEIAS